MPLLCVDMAKANQVLSHHNPNKSGDNGRLCFLPQQLARSEGGSASPELNQQQCGVYVGGRRHPARQGWQIYFCTKETVPSMSLQRVVKPDPYEI